MTCKNCERMRKCEIALERVAKWETSEHSGANSNLFGLCREFAQDVLNDVICPKCNSKTEDEKEMYCIGNVAPELCPEEIQPSPAVQRLVEACRQVLETESIRPTVTRQIKKALLAYEEERKKI